MVLNGRRVVGYRRGHNHALSLPLIFSRRLPIYCMRLMEIDHKKISTVILHCKLLAKVCVHNTG